jgi:hypothetical protein
MRFVLPCLAIATLAVSAPLSAQQPSDPFRWVDFHSAQNQKDQSVVTWVTRSLGAEKWTAIREIGVQYDAALVITTERPTSQSLPAADTFTVWTVSLTSHIVAPLVTGVNLRLLDWMNFASDKPRELGALYDDCADCAASTFFTAFYYDLPHHLWSARWMSGRQAVPVWSTNASSGVALSQVYALLSDPDGRQRMGTWSRFDYGAKRPAEDFVYRYDLDSFTSLERAQRLFGKEADAMKQQLCGAQDSVSGLMRGQDSPLCQQTLKVHPERKPVTTPPANNQGRSVPPAARR